MSADIETNRQELGLRDGLAGRSWKYMAAAAMNMTVGTVMTRLVIRMIAGGSPFLVVVMVVVMQAAGPFGAIGDVHKLVIASRQCTVEPDRAASRGDDKDQRQKMDSDLSHARMKPLFAGAVKLRPDNEDQAQARPAARILGVQSPAYI